MSRTPLIVGNWKMHKTIQETKDFCLRLKNELAGLKGSPVEVAVAPPFPALAVAAEALLGSSISVAAQDTFWAESGAFTGEVSPPMLLDAGCRYAIIGHSERRQYFYENDESVNKKAAALMKAGLIPILCLGESLSERQGALAFSVVERQLRLGLKDGGAKNPADLVIAYEPVWAIGTGQTATPQQAQEIHALLRSRLKELFPPAMAEGVRILYGGSVKPDNTAQLMAMEDVDGALVGGASLDVPSFAGIVRGAWK